MAVLLHHTRRHHRYISTHILKHTTHTHTHTHTHTRITHAQHTHTHMIVNDDTMGIYRHISGDDDADDDDDDDLLLQSTV